MTNKAGWAWQYTDESNELPYYKCTVSVAIINQSKTDDTGCINLQVRRLTEPDSRTKATHIVYVTSSHIQEFDSHAELIISVNRQKLRNCFFMNGFYSLLVQPMENKILKKLNAYSYKLFEDQSMVQEKKKVLPPLGYAYLKIQISFDKEEFEVGKLFAFEEHGEPYLNLYIDKIKTLSMADPERCSFYIAARHEKDHTYSLYFSPEVNYKAVDFLFNFSRNAFMKLGMSDNNGNVVFVAYQDIRGMIDGGDFEIYYALYHADNQIREKEKFTDASGWLKENMVWVN